MEDQEASPQNHRLKMIDLMTMDNNQWGEMRKRVSVTHGSVQLVVHTHYGETDSNSELAEGTYLEDIGKALKQKGLPIVALIDSNDSDDPEGEILDFYRKKYSEISPDEQKQIYFVRTHADSPQPYIRGYRKSDWKSSWDNFADTLSSLGVTSVILRGRNLHLYDSSRTEMGRDAANFLEKHDELKLNEVSKPDRLKRLITRARGRTDHDNDRFNYPGGCLGTTWVELENRGIKVKLSRITYPHSKYDL